MWRFNDRDVPKPKKITYNFVDKLTPNMLDEDDYVIQLMARGGIYATDNLSINVSETTYGSLSETEQAIASNNFPVSRDYISYCRSVHLMLNGRTELEVGHCEDGYYIALGIVNRPELRQRVSIDTFETVDSVCESIFHGDWHYVNIIQHLKYYNRVSKLMVLEVEDGYQIGRKVGKEISFDDMGTDRTFSSKEEALKILEKHLDSVY